LLPSSPLTRRLTSTLTLAISTIVLLAALLGPAQTLAQTRKLTCSGAAAHPRSKHTSHACPARPSHKRKARHASGRHGKHPLGNGDAGTTIALVPATCEDGSTPVQVSGGSLSCSDGSVPACEDGSTPTRSAKGAGLLCAVPIEGGSEAGEGECEEELEAACAGEPPSGTGEQTCTTSSSSSTSFVCEAES
jgi:hypothetical protein